MKLKKTILALAVSGSIAIPALSHASTTQQPKVQNYKTAPYRGVNLGGGAFYNNTWNPASGSYDTYHFVPYAPDGDLFYDKGANTFRIPVSWEYLAGKNEATTFKIDYRKNASGQYVNTYLQNVTNLLTQLTKRFPSAHIILDLHNYMHYSKTGYLVDDYEYGSKIGDPGEPTMKQYEQVWQSIDKNIVQPIDHNNSIMLELMNEPYSNQGDTDDQAKEFDQSIGDAYWKIVKQISKTDPQRKFVLDGTNWSGLHSWASDDGKTFLRPTEEPITDMLNDMTKAQRATYTNKLMIDVHQYFDTKSTGDYIKYKGCDVNGASKFKKIIHTMNTWSKANNIPYIIGETGIPEFENSKTTNVCISDMQSMWDNAYNSIKSTNSAGKNFGFKGISLWSGGHAWGVVSQNNIAPGACKINLASGAPVKGEPNDYFYKNTFFKKMFTPVPTSAAYNGHATGALVSTIYNDSATNVYPSSMPYINPQDPSDNNNGEHIGAFASTPTCNIVMAGSGQIKVYKNSYTPTTSGADAFEFFIPSAYDDGSQSKQLSYGGGESVSGSEHDGYIYMGQDHNTPDGYMVSPIAWGDAATKQPYYITDGKAHGSDYEAYVKGKLDSINHGALTDIVSRSAIVDSGYSPTPSATGTINVDSINKGNCDDSEVTFANLNGKFSTDKPVNETNEPLGKWTVTAGENCKVKSLVIQGKVAANNTFTLSAGEIIAAEVTLEKGSTPPPTPAGKCAIKGEWAKNNPYYAQYVIDGVYNGSKAVWEPKDKDTLKLNVNFSGLPATASGDIGGTPVSNFSKPVAATLPKTWWLGVGINASGDMSTQLPQPTCTFADK